MAPVDHKAMDFNLLHGITKMVDKWFKTPNNQILNTQYFKSFWIEEVPDGQFHVFGQDMENCDWRLAEHENVEEAERYISIIFAWLCGHE